MKRNVELVNLALVRIANGEPLPSFLSEDFGALMDAARECVAPLPCGAIPRATLAEIGNFTVGLLMARLKASVGAERAIIEMKAIGGKLN